MYIILLVFHIITIQHGIWKNNRRNITYMKATGIVRRIDDLGRVVIPKEIRRTLRIKEGTPLEIFSDRRAEYFCKGICGGSGTDDRHDGMHHRS